MARKKALTLRPTDGSIWGHFAVDSTACSVQGGFAACALAERRGKAASMLHALAVGSIFDVVFAGVLLY